MLKKQSSKKPDKKSEYSIERGLISELLHTKDYGYIKDRQISSKLFGGEHKKVFKFISECCINSGSVPTVRAVLHKFPDYDLEYFNKEVGTEEPLQFWCEEIRNQAKHNKMISVIEDVVDELEDFKTDEAYTNIKKLVVTIENDIIETSSIDITTNTEDRIEAYKKRELSGGMTGISTGINELDYLLKGLPKKTLTTIIANTGVGKTWFLILLGAYAMLNGYKVLQFSTEMSEEQMQDRYEAVLYGMTVGSINYSKFKEGRLHPKTKAKYFDFLENVLPTLTPLRIEGATSVSSISAKIDELQPDLVFVDSAYLMEDDQGADSDWLRIAHITRDLKKVTKNKGIPIVINSQADSNTSKRTGPELENIGFSKAIGQDSDNVLALFRDEQMFEDNEMKVKVLKQREGTTGSFMMNWDFSCMNFSSIYGDRHDSDEEEQKPNTMIDIND